MRDRGARAPGRARVAAVPRARVRPAAIPPARARAAQAAVALLGRVAPGRAAGPKAVLVGPQPAVRYKETAAGRTQTAARTPAMAVPAKRDGPAGAPGRRPDVASPILTAQRDQSASAGISHPAFRPRPTRSVRAAPTPAPSQPRASVETAVSVSCPVKAACPPTDR